MGYFDKNLFKSVGMAVDEHGKMPDVIIYYEEKEWLVLAEAVTSHGPVHSKRHEELSLLFSDATPNLVFVSTFPIDGHLLSTWMRFHGKQRCGLLTIPAI